MDVIRMVIRRLCIVAYIIATLRAVHAEPRKKGRVLLKYLAGGLFIYFFLLDLVVYLLGIFAMGYLIVAVLVITALSSFFRSLFS